MPTETSHPFTELPAVHLDHVSRVYGSFAALRDVGLTLETGSSVVLLGENGAGKSTLLKVLAGLTRATHGRVQVLGQDPGAATLRGKVAYMGHHTMLYDELTGPENLAYLLPLQRPELTADQVSAEVARAMQAVGLDPANPRRVGEYSQGMRQRASLARVLLGQPSLLLLDEPFSNLDVDSAHAMIRRLQQWLIEPAPGAPRRTMLLTTHQAQLARPLARTTLLLHAGRLQERREGSASQAGTAGASA